MKTSLALVSSLSILALTACSSQLEKETASGNYEYLTAEQSEKLKIPEGLDQPEYSEDYTLPPLGDEANESLVGREIKVKSPPLVLPLVTGSHVEEGSRSATVMFDKVDDSQPLDKAIWNSLLNYLDQEGIGVDKFEPENNTLVTDWMIISSEEDDGPWYQWSSTEKQVGRRFEFNLEMKPHGRSAALSVQLRDYMATKGDDVDASINELEERREEVAILNQIITHYEYQIQLEDSRRIAKIRQGLDIEMGFNADGDPAYVVSAQYDVAWPRLLLVMRKMGFDVKDLDKSTGLLFVTYNGANDSWWSGWFGSDEALLEEDDYRLRVSEAGPEKTVITFMNDQSEPFEANQVSDLYEPFSQVMAEDNLDI